MLRQSSMGLRWWAGPTTTREWQGASSLFLHFTSFLSRLKVLLSLIRLTLGGGYGWRTSDMGLVCDNVVEFKAVLANGAVVVVNETSEPDLFFALRGAFLFLYPFGLVLTRPQLGAGGGGSFGVVTQFKFRLYPQAPEVFFHRSVHLPTSLEKILAIAESTNKDGEDRSSVIVMNVTSIKTRRVQPFPFPTHFSPGLTCACHMLL